MSARATDPRVPRATDGLVVAIDGPAGSGKSTIARQVAITLGVRYLDTGAMYRAATWWVLERAIDPAEASSRAAVIDAVRGLVLVSVTDPRSPSIIVRPPGGSSTDVTIAVRSAEVTAAVSAVSAIPEVRELLVAAQRLVIDEGGIVVEGRDIGTTVWPTAPVKVYLTASEHVRAVRRLAEATPALGQRDVHARDGVTAADDVQQVRADLDRRDRFDSSRAVSPLAKAPDAVVIDSTGLDIAAVVEGVLELVRARTGIGFGDDLALRDDVEPFQQSVTLGARSSVVITDGAPRDDTESTALTAGVGRVSR